MARISPIVRGMCPNCGGDIEAERLEAGLPCARCLPDARGEMTPVEVGEALLERGAMRGYAWVYGLEREYSQFRRYFVEKTGRGLWSAQASWARRLLMLDSFAIIAPTGVGKTTLLSVYAAYRAEVDGWRVLYIVPTQNLVRQTAEALARIVDGVVYYVGSMGKKAREEALSKIEAGEFRILVVTTSFLQRRFDMLERHAPYDLIIVDDVDSLLRSGANVERVLVLMGFSPRIIEIAERVVRARLKLYQALAQGAQDRIEELEREIASLETQLLLEADRPRSQLVIASATGRPRGLKHLIFRELLGFEVGGGSDYLRDVTDTYKISGDPAKDAIDVAKTLGPGGIIFVSQLHGKAAARLLVEKLRSAGVRAELALAGARRAVAKLARGEADVVVGVASRYGVVVRGIDLPEKIRYAVFVEVPARKMRLRDALNSPRRLLNILLFMADRGDDEAGEYARRLARGMEKLPDTRLLALAMRGAIEASGLLGEVASLAREAASHVEARLPAILSAEGGIVRLSGTVIEMTGEGEIYLILPDAPTYIQASGRTSRLYRGSMTHGLSVILSRRREYVEALAERLSWYTNSKMVPLDNVSLDEELQRIERSRRGEGRKVNVKTVLMIVESPTKAKTIAWFWGRPGKRRIGRLTVYETSTIDPETGTVYLLSVTSSRGHLLDLAIDEEDSVYGVRVRDGTYMPVYAPIRKCRSCGYTYAGSGPCPRCGSRAVYSTSAVIEALRKLATEVDEVVIATDPDREGEKIAWDLKLLLKPYNRSIRRGKFHEVTRPAVLEALRSAGEVDKNLVNAQIVRRIEDRWIGFSLSRHLWAVYGKPWLGAGRVQTPVLGWVVERYGEWRSTRGYSLVLGHEATGERLYVYTPEKPSLKVGGRAKVVVEEYSEWDDTIAPPPPFTTDELLYEASRRLGLGASLTMRLAQDLFESGLITYHRTDSTRVSPAGIGVAMAYLEKKGLSEHAQPRGWGEGGAHEAIRPTRPLDAGELERSILDGTIRVPIRITRLHLRLYDLIFRRFIASQMKPARVRRARAVIRIEEVNTRVEKEAVIDYEKTGFALVNPPRASRMIRELGRAGEAWLVVRRIGRASKVMLYKTGDLVKLMKEKGIGRPSTYAKAIEANRRHGYVVISKKRQYVVPTRLGREVYSYLSSNFSPLISVDTSRRMEEALEKIAEGKVDPGEALDEVASLIGSLVGDEALSVVVGGGERGQLVEGGV